MYAAMVAAANRLRTVHPRRQDSSPIGVGRNDGVGIYKETTFMNEIIVTITGIEEQRLVFKANNSFNVAGEITSAFKLAGLKNFSVKVVDPKQRVRYQYQSTSRQS